MRYCAIFWKLLALAALYSYFPLAAQSDENKEGKATRGTRGARYISGDMKVIEDLQQIHLNQSSIMFWRPQKVGSSTVLSLLTSYGYRFNAPPRRKTPLINSMCIKMAQCALSEMEYADNSLSVSSNSTELRTYLNRYIQYRSDPHRREPPPMRPGTTEAEALCERQSYKISSSHQICNLRSDVVKSSLQCTFSNSTGGYKQALNAYSGDFNQNHFDYSTAVKELFVVRNPLSRAISVYYFWGELFKMHRIIKRRVSLKGTDKRPRKDRLLLTDKYDEYSDQLSSLDEQQDQYMSLEDYANDENESRRLTTEQKEVLRLGSHGDGPVKGSLFTYHGNETSVPPFAIAMAFAQNLPYKAGMPGPSFTW